MVVTSSSPVAGQAVPRYRVTNLGELGFLPSPADPETGQGSGTFGINDHGEVAFARQVAGVLRATIWLPKPAYGLPAGVHDLETVFGPGSFPQPSIAREINDHGQVAGQVGGTGDGAGEAVVWDLGAAPHALIALGVLPGGTWSRAFSIDDGIPATVVGESEWADQCRSTCLEGLPPENTAFLVSFRVLLDGTNQLVRFDPLLPTCDPSSFARDVSRNPTSGQVMVAGFSDQRSLDELELCASNEEPACAGARDSVIWAPGPSPVLSIDLDQPSQPRGSEASGINESGEMVGWGYQPPSIQCSLTERALYWDALGNVTNLGLSLPPGFGNDTSRAEAINDADPPTIVGWDTSINLPLRWERDGSGWAAFDLMEEIPGCWIEPVSEEAQQEQQTAGCICPWIKLWQAHDVNTVAEKEWVVTWGVSPPSNPVPHAYVLSPVTDCYWDLEPSGHINFADLNILLTQWGPCGIGVHCIGDLDFTCSVGNTDLNILLALWGPTCGGSAALSTSGLPPAFTQAWLMSGGEEAIAAGHVTAAEIAECMSAASFGDRFISLCALLGE